jgi:hypothetical protein
MRILIIQCPVDFAEFNLPGADFVATVEAVSPHAGN